MNLSNEYSDQMSFKSKRVTNQMWKANDRRAQKNGSHGNIYWVKKQKKNQDGSEKQSKWISSNKYVGDWKNNKKDGFGIQYFMNGDKFQGGWKQNKRHGQGTHWISQAKNRLRRQYTGDWEYDRKKGRGTMFHKNGDRYDGVWVDDLPNGQGRMIYANGDVYQGLWYLGKRSGYGVLTKRNGDHFEGKWVNDKRQGQGSYFYSKSNQVFVGQWVDDTPKTGIYSQVQDPYSIKPQREKHFNDQYILPEIPQIKLENPNEVLQQSMQDVRKQRTIYRATYIPIDELYTKQQLMKLQRQFSFALNGSEYISEVSMRAALWKMCFDLTGNDMIIEQQLSERISQIKGDYNADQIDYETFVRVIAIILQEDIFMRQTEEQKKDLSDYIA